MMDLHTLGVGFQPFAFVEGLVIGAASIRTESFVHRRGATNIQPVKGGNG